MQLASGPGFTPSVIGITQVTLANTVVVSGVQTVQTTGGRTSPLIVMAPNKLQQFGAQIIMLPSPNQITASPHTSVVETTGVQVHSAPQPSASPHTSVVETTGLQVHSAPQPSASSHTSVVEATGLQVHSAPQPSASPHTSVVETTGLQVHSAPQPSASPHSSVVETTGVQVHIAPQPSAETNVECDNNADTAIESCTTLNTISLPETSSCSPDGEALLEKLDKMETSNVIDISPLKNLSESTEAVDLHELTAYLTQGEEEASMTTTSTQSLTTSTHSDTITSQAAVTVTSSLETVVTTTVVSSEHSTDSIDTVTRSLGFNPISRAEPEANTLDSQENSGPSEKQKHDTDVETSESAKLSQVASPSVIRRPSSREGMYPSMYLQGGRSRPNSRGAAHSPSTKQSGGFVQLGEHTRDSPNIFVSIQSAMPPTGKQSVNFKMNVVNMRNT